MISLGYVRQPIDRVFCTFNMYLRIFSFESYAALIFCLPPLRFFPPPPRYQQSETVAWAFLGVGVVLLLTVGLSYGRIAEAINAYPTCVR